MKGGDRTRYHRATVLIKKKLKFKSIPWMGNKTSTVRREMQMDDMETDRMYMADDEADANKESKNIKELRELRREIDRIVAEGLCPPEEWYQTRRCTIVTYSELDWRGLVDRFDEHDLYMHSTALNIMYNIQVLLEEHDQMGHFDLRNFQHLIHDIHNIWTHFKNKYIGEETDTDVCDLIVGLSHI